MAQDRATQDTRWGSDSAYTFELQRCLCYGQKPSTLQQINTHGTRAPLDMSPQCADRTHRVWVAFLEYSNDEYESERSMRDYFILPMNWLTVQLTGRPFIHCQLVFWDERRKQYYTFSVDSKRPVHVFDRKAFLRGWKFVELTLTERQELLIHNFCVAQLGKPLNTTGQLSIFLFPMSGGGHSWFCSELTTAALAQAGIIDYSVWPGVKDACSAAPHNLYDYLLKHCITCLAQLLPGNPVSVAIVHKAARSRGKIDLPAAGELPRSITSHATSSTATAPPIMQNDLTTQLAAMPIDRRTSPLDYLVIRK